MGSDKQIKLYSELAAWWPLLSTPADYAEEAEFYSKVLLTACQSPPQSVLELGSGGGNNASHMKAYFQLTLVDRSPAMLAVSQALNPGIEHFQGDMRTVRLDHLFDAVFIHDAIMYLTSRKDLLQAMRTAYAHCRPGGAALFCPDCTRETFRPYTDHGGHDGDTRALRYLEWVWDPDPADDTYVCEFAYLLREGSQIKCESERHVLGLFSRQDWLNLLAEAGFQPGALPFEHSDNDQPIEVFVGVKT
jgi:SAM-dependent methyltransferase